MCSRSRESVSMRRKRKARSIIVWSAPMGALRAASASRKTLMGRRWLRSSRTACSWCICQSRRKRSPRASRSRSAEGSSERAFSLSRRRLSRMLTLPRKGNAMPNMSLLHTRATIALLAVAMLGLAASASAEDKALPRAFQKAHLGMNISELLQEHPQLAKANTDVRDRQSVVLSSHDPHILRQEYKFHQGALYELQIYYHPDRLPRGHAGLLARLKEVY